MTEEKKPTQDPEMQYLGLSTITNNFRITIPKEIREFLQIKKNTYDIAIFWGCQEDKDQITITFHKMEYRSKSQ